MRITNVDTVQTRAELNDRIQSIFVGANGSTFETVSFTASPESGAGIGSLQRGTVFRIKLRNVGESEQSGRIRSSNSVPYSKSHRYY